MALASTAVVSRSPQGERGGPVVERPTPWRGDWPRDVDQKRLTIFFQEVADTPSTPVIGHWARGWV